MASDVFQIVKELSRKELERHQKRIIGITASAPQYKDQNGVNEWVCDVRVGRREEQGLIRDVLVAQWALGVVNDLGVPVLIERSEAGRLTIIARSQVRLPDLSVRTFSYAQLGLLFIAGVVEVDGVFFDGFGHPVEDPSDLVGTATTWTWVQELTPLDELEEDDELDSVRAAWQAT